MAQPASCLGGVGTLVGRVPEYTCATSAPVRLPMFSRVKLTLTRVAIAGLRGDVAIGEPGVREAVAERELHPRAVALVAAVADEHAFVEGYVEDLRREGRVLDAELKRGLLQGGSGELSRLIGRPTTPLAETMSSALRG